MISARRATIQVRVHQVDVLCLMGPIDWEQTSLKRYVEMLDNHTARLMDEKRLAKKAQGK
jgi:hypothetical protein